MKKILLFIGIFIYLTTPVFSHSNVPGPTAEGLLPQLTLVGFIFILIIIISTVGKIKYNWGIVKIIGTFIAGLFVLILLFIIAMIVSQ